MAKIIIYTKKTCYFCVSAKRLLNQKALSYEEIDIGGNADLTQEMIRLSGRFTVPQIFINDQPIGGYVDLAQMNSMGEIDEMLEDCRS